MVTNLLFGFHCMFDCCFKVLISAKMCSIKNAFDFELCPLEETFDESVEKNKPAYPLKIYVAIGER
jgi:hypothetical protein